MFHSFTKTSSMKIIQASFRTLMAGSVITPAQQTKISGPRVFIIDGGELAKTKTRIRSGDQYFAAALARLEKDAQRALQQPPTSVVTKTVAPPSGDKHDYLSQAPYYWP